MTNAGSAVRRKLMPRGFAIAGPWAREPVSRQQRRLFELIRWERPHMSSRQTKRRRKSLKGMGGKARAFSHVIFMSAEQPQTPMSALGRRAPRTPPNCRSWRRRLAGRGTKRPTGRPAQPHKQRIG